MTDSRHSESPSSPPNHSSVSGTGTTNVMNVPAGSQYEAHIPFLMSHSSSRFIPPLNMPPIFPPGMKPPGKPIGVSTSTDLGPPMFQIPLNLGPPSSGLQKHPQVASSMISPASLPSMTPVFLSGAAAPTPMYNPVHTSMSRPFMVPFQAHIPAGLNPTLSSLDANTPKTMNKLMSGTLSLSPSPPLQPTGKKHSSKVTSRVSSSTSSQKISTLSTHSATDGGNSAVQNEAPTNSFVGNNTQVDDKSESATKTNALHEVHHPRETKVAGTVKGYVKNTNSVDHNSSYRISANSNSMQNEDEDCEEGKPGTECGASVGTRTSEASKFDPNQLLSYYNNIKKEPVHAKDRGLHESKETVRKTVGLPSDGSASSTRHTWSTDETRNTNTNVQSDPTAPSLPTNSGVNRSVSAMGQSSQVFKQQTSFDSVTEVDKGTTPTQPQTHRPAVVSTPASTSAGHPLLPTKPASVNSPNTSVAALPLNSSKLPHPASCPTTPSSLSMTTSTAGNSVVGPPPSSTPSNTFTVPHSPRPSTSQATTALSPVSTPPRPSILRKRTNDKRAEPLSPISIRQNLMSVPTLVDQIRSGSESNLSSNEASEVMSPRKKPRKQNMMTADDQFASAIPECPMDGVGSLTCNNEDVPPSPDCSRSPSPGDTHCLEGKDKTCVSQPVFRRDGDFESSLRLLAELKRPPVLGGYRVNSKATQNHFWRYSDFKVKEQSKPSVMSIAQKKNIRLRVKGWRVGRVNDHMDTMVSNEEDIIRTLTTTQECLKKLLEESTSESSSPSVASSQERSSSDSLLEMVQGNFDRSRNIITCIRQTQSVLGKILHHKSKALDLVQKCAPDSFSLETVTNRSHNFTRQ